MFESLLSALPIVIIVLFAYAVFWRYGSREFRGQLFIVKRRIVGPQGSFIEACEGTYHARGRKSLEGIFQEECQRFEQLCLGCRLEHKVVEEE